MSRAPSKRDRFCRPPKYPGKPSDYIFVDRYCRKHKSQAPRTSRIKVNNKSGLTTQGVTIQLMGELLDIMPEYIVFLVRQMRSASLVRQALDTKMRYNLARAKWRGLPFPNSAHIRDAVMALL